MIYCGKMATLNCSVERILEGVCLHNFIVVFFLKFLILQFLFFVDCTVISVKLKLSSISVTRKSMKNPALSSREDLNLCERLTEYCLHPTIKNFWDPLIKKTEQNRVLIMYMKSLSLNGKPAKLNFFRSLNIFLKRIRLNTA